MNSRSRQHGQIMLIILGSLFLGAGAATGIFTSGKSIESLRKEAGKMGLAEPRRNRVYELLDEWKAIAEPAQHDFKDYGETLLTLLGQQHASPADFEAVLSRQRAELEFTERQLLPVREALRETLEADEWKRLFQ